MILIISTKNVYAARRLKQELGIRNYEVEILSVEDLVKAKFKFNITEYSCLYIRNPYFKTSSKYIPKIIALAKAFKAAGKKVVDENITKGFLGVGKIRSYNELLKAKISIPNTYTLNIDKLLLNNYPFILKWEFGMQGKDTFLVKSKTELTKTLKLHPKREWILQEYIEADYEYKVITIGYKSLPIVLRFDFNKQLGRVDFEKSKVININKVKDLKEISEKASKTLGRELAKVDILEKDGKLYVLEVNRCPGLKSFEELTRFNVIKEFVKHLQK